MIAFTKVNLPYGWLSNMSPHKVFYCGKEYRTAEHLFQCLRFASDDPQREKVRSSLSPMTAKMVAKNGNFLVVPQSYEDVNNMRLVLKLKTEQHPDLKQALKDTGDEVIVEDCSARPRGSSLFWGGVFKTFDSQKFVGKNVLGELWMELRKKLN